MGADEQLAGYARHRTRFEKEGFIALISEVKMEMKRISERNLGRDDRIISGKVFKTDFVYRLSKKNPILRSWKRIATTIFR